MRSDEECWENLIGAILSAILVSGVVGFLMWQRVNALWQFLAAVIAAFVFCLMVALLWYRNGRKTQ